MAILRGVLIDADVLIEAERGKFDFDGWIRSLPGVDFKLAAITVSEIQHGAERGRGVRAPGPGTLTCAVSAAS